MPNPLFMVLLLFAVMLALKPDADTTGITGGTAADRERMAELSQAWLDAYLSDDPERIVAILHEDAVVMPHNQETATGSEEVRQYLETHTGRSGDEFSDDVQEIRINRDWAYVRGRFTLMVGAGDGMQRYVRNGRYLVLFEKVGNDWKMLRNMDNAAPAPAG